jgi:hypothetical protein
MLVTCIENEIVRENLSGSNFFLVKIPWVSLVRSGLQYAFNFTSKYVFDKFDTDSNRLLSHLLVK